MKGVKFKLIKYLFIVKFNTEGNEAQHFSAGSVMIEYFLGIKGSLRGVQGKSGPVVTVRPAHSIQLQCIHMCTF